MSEFWSNYGDNTVPCPQASREEQARCLRNRLKFNTARSTVLITLATYFGLATLLHTPKTSQPLLQKTEEKQTDSHSSAPAVSPTIPSFNPLEPTHDGATSTSKAPLQ